MNDLYNTLNKYRKVILMLIDFIIAVISYLFLMYMTDFNHENILVDIERTIIFIIIYIGTFLVMGVYKNMLRYAGIQAIFQCLKASVLGNLIFFIITFRLDITMKYYEYFLVFLTSSFLTSAMRIVYRTIKLIIYKHNFETKVKINVMIIGAGRATDLLLSELDYNNPCNYSIKCIIDDDETKKNRDMHNIPVVGDRDKIAEMASKYLIELIIISMPSVDAENKKNIIEICSATKCKLKILPAICSLISSEDN